MKLSTACIPLGLIWSSPFVRWQGSLASVSSLDLAVQVTADAISRRDMDPSGVTDIVLGWTVPQPGIFYGAPTVAGRLGMPGVTGPMISQACATSVACLQAAAAMQGQVATSVVLVVTADRTSNGPVLTYPAPERSGGAEVERWVLDAFERDPWGGTSMLATAEAVATEANLTRGEVDELTFVRHQQYRSALENDREFQQPWMVPARIERRRKPVLVVEADEGIHDTTMEGLGELSPLVPNGVVTYGTQTHPADGSAGMVVTSEGRARQLSRGEGIVRVLSTGFARVEAARMPKAPVPAAEMALRDAQISIGDVDVIKTHNPFVVNDLYFARATGVDAEAMNPCGCSLVYGHPQAPTGIRSIAELTETLRRRGGGVGLFTGCAAGDTAGAAVLQVDD